MNKLELALARVKALHTLPEYTSAEAVEIVRIAMALTNDEADLVAKQHRDFMHDCAEAALNPWS